MTDDLLSAEVDDVKDPTSLSCHACRVTVRLLIGANDEPKFDAREQASLLSTCSPTSQPIGEGRRGMTSCSYVGTSPPKRTTSAQGLRTATFGTIHTYSLI